MNATELRIYCNTDAQKRNSRTDIAKFILFVLLVWICYISEPILEIQAFDL